jgi:hypothetical protein
VRTWVFEGIDVATDVLKWADLSDYSIELFYLRFPDGQPRLVFRGSTAPFERAIISQLKFTKTNSGALVRDGGRINFQEIQKIFPKARVVDMLSTRVIRTASERDQRMAQVAEEITLRQARPLGLNHLGQEVFQGVMGRFVRAGGAGGGLIREDQAQSPAIFLRAASDEALALCAQGFVDQMMRGRSMKKGDFEVFVRTVYDIPSIPKGDGRAIRVNQAIELAMAKRWLSETAGPDRHAFGVAIRLHEAQPIRLNSVRREAVPLPIVAAVAAISSAVRPKKVGVLQAGNGSLAAALSAESVVVSEPDTAYRASADHITSPSITAGDLLPGAYPVTVSLAPGRAIPGNTVGGVYINRNDHLAGMQALTAREVSGRSVLVMSSDSGDASQTGSILGSRDFLNWVYQNYQVEGFLEVEGNLTRKLDTGWPYRILVVGERRVQPDREQVAPDTISVASSFDELWEFTLSLSSGPEYERADVVADKAVQDVVAPAPAQDAGMVLNPVSESRASEENSYQAPYVPFSRLGVPEAMIPRNLLAPTNRALSRVAQEHGDIDRYVASQLGFSDHRELEPLYSPEQIDALALAVTAMGKGKGFVEGDMTGLGKGRVLAGIARWAFSQGKPVVFITEKANLFSDYWRDLTDTRAEGLCKPFIVNAGASIINAQGERVLKSPKKDLQDEIFESKETPWDMGYNLVIGTYSQFSRPPETYAKSAWLPRACAGAVVILDESHNAAGESQINKNFELALEEADSVMFSSATFAKSAENMAIYRKVFPRGLSADELRETLEAGGEPLYEVLSASLAEDGVLVRREHDMSNLTFETLVDTDRISRNEQLADDMSEIMVLMSKASQVATKLMEVAQQRDRKGFFTIPNFGSRRYLANRQFMLALKLDQATDLAVKALENGEKPVLVVESTMESLIREAVLGEEMTDEQLLSGDVSVEPVDSPEAVSEQDIRAVTFRDVLAKIFDRSITIKRAEDEESERLHALDLNVPDALKKELQDLRDRAMSLIQSFPDMPASPLDAFREKIEAAGFTCGEISGRGVRLETVSEGRQRVVSNGVVNRAQVVRAFNEGELDVVVLTRSGSTGISMQNSPKFKDQRQRVMIEAQIFNNVAERMQVYGRCNRKGQISSPKIITLSSGLPGEVRSLSMQKKKMRQLSSTTTSNRDSAVDSDDVLDLINPLGEAIARSYLEGRPVIADRLGIDPNRPMKDSADTYVVNACTARLDMLKTAEQREVLDDLAAEYAARLAELDSQGLNPFKLTEHDWKARVIAEEVFEPAQSADSVLDAGVYLRQIEYERIQRPIRSHQLVKMSEDSLAALSTDLRVATVAGKTVNWRDVVKAMTQAALVNVRKLQGGAIEGRFDSVEAALASNKANPVQTLQKKYREIVDVLGLNLELGRVVRFEHAGETIAGVMVGIKLPPPGKEHLSGQYEVKILRSGLSDPYPFSLATMLAGKVQCDKGVSLDVIHKHFDDAPEGRVKIKRMILDGNMFRSSQYAVRHKLGHSVTYTDDKGNRKRAVLLNRDIRHEHVMQLPIRVGDPKLVKSWLTSGVKTPEVCTSPDRYGNIDDAVLLSRLDDGKFHLDMPKSGSMGWVARDAKLVKLVGKSAGRHRSRTTFDASKIDAVVRRLSDAGVRFYAPAEARKMVLEAAKSPKKANRKSKQMEAA